VLDTGLKPLEPNNYVDTKASLLKMSGKFIILNAYKNLAKNRLFIIAPVQALAMENIETVCHYSMEH